jgi:gas vesicle protein
MSTRDVLAGAGIGAALAFMFDPAGGGRRRALARDKAVRAMRKTRDGLDATARDMAQRARGIAAASRGRWSNETVDDGRLLERVRAKLGRACSHPRAIDVEVREGEVTLRGPILAGEVDDLLATAEAVRGVRAVVNELDPHEDASGIPSLQGEGRTAGPSLDIMQHNWAPATRALVTAGIVATGVYLASYARRDAHAA